MQNLARFCHYHEGEPHERAFKIGGSFLAVLALALTSGSINASTELDDYAQLQSRLLPEVSFRIATIANTLPQGDARLEGFVYSPNGGALGGVEVRLRSASGQEGSNFSDNSGKYFFDHVAQGSYQLYAMPLTARNDIQPSGMMPVSLSGAHSMQNITFIITTSGSGGTGSTSGSGSTTSGSTSGSTTGTTSTTSGTSQTGSGTSTLPKGSARVDGFVVSPDGTYLNGVTVGLGGSNGNASIQTDGAGKFFFDSVGAGTFTLGAGVPTGKNWLPPAQKTIDIPAGSTMFYSYDLRFMQNSDTTHSTTNTTQGGTLQISVKDSQGMYVSEVELWLAPSTTPNQRMWTKTGASGIAQLAGLGSGEWKIVEIKLPSNRTDLSYDLASLPSARPESGKTVNLEVKLAKKTAICPKMPEVSSCQSGEELKYTQATADGCPGYAYCQKKSCPSIAAVYCPNGNKIDPATGCALGVCNESKETQKELSKNCPKPTIQCPNGYEMGAVSGCPLDRCKEAERQQDRQLKKVDLPPLDDTQGENQHTDWVNPEEAQRIIGEMKNLREEVSRSLPSKTTGTRRVAKRQSATLDESDKAQLEALLLDLSEDEAAIRKSYADGDLSTLGSAMRNYYDARYWEVFQPIRAKIELPNELNHMLEDLAVLKEVVVDKKKKWGRERSAVKYFKVNEKALVLTLGQLNDAYVAAKTKYDARDYNGAQEELEIMHQGSHPGEVRGILHRLAGSYEQILQIKDKTVRAKFKQLFTPVIETINAAASRAAASDEDEDGSGRSDDTFREAHNALNELEKPFNNLVSKAMKLNRKQFTSRLSQFNTDFKSLSTLIDQKLNEAPPASAESTNESGE